MEFCSWRHHIKTITSLAREVSPSSSFCAGFSVMSAAWRVLWAECSCDFNGSRETAATPETVRKQQTLDWAPDSGHCLPLDDINSLRNKFIAGICAASLRRRRALQIGVGGRGEIVGCWKLINIPQPQSQQNWVLSQPQYKPLIIHYVNYLDVSDIHQFRGRTPRDVSL